MDSSELMEQFLRTADRFLKIDLGVLLEGITQGEYMVLSAIYDSSRWIGDFYGAPISEIVRSLQVLPASLSRTLRSLEKKGLAEKKSHCLDRRSGYVCLTMEGERLRKIGCQRLLTFADGIAAAMGEEATYGLLSLWGRLADVVSEKLTEYEKTRPAGEEPR